MRNDYLGIYRKSPLQAILRPSILIFGINRFEKTPRTVLQRGYFCPFTIRQIDFSELLLTEMLRAGI
jgi:hypothetical protein